MNEHASKSADHTQAGHRTRLRKRLLDGGPQGFHDYELVEYLLTLTIPRVDTKPLAKRLIHDFGGIGPLLSASAEALRREGLTDPTVAALKIAQAGAVPAGGGFVCYDGALVHAAPLRPIRARGGLARLGCAGKGHAAIGTVMGTAG